MKLWLLGALACCAMGCSSSTEEARPLEPAEDAAQGDVTHVQEPDTFAALDASGLEEDPHPFSYSPCPLSERLGGFTVTLAQDYTGVNGEVANGVVPGNIPEVVAEAGPCRLLQKPSLFCAPACVPGETCGADGACIAYPENQSVGRVEVTGFKSPLSMDAKWGNYYGNPGTMEHPGFVSDALLTLRAFGEDLQGFTLGGFGVSPLTIPKAQVMVDDSTAVELEWASGSPHDGVQIHTELNINNHGSTSAWIACDSPDTGSLEIPQPLLTELFKIGVSGFPSLAISRRSVHSTALAVGCVEFTVRADQDVSIEVAGVTSCTSDAQCGPAQTCGADLQCHGS